MCFHQLFYGHDRNAIAQWYYITKSATKSQHCYGFQLYSQSDIATIVETQIIDVDMLSASAHKFNGTKGVGFLYVKKGTPLEPLMHGGGQEMGMRSGTENVASIVGMAAALQEHMKTIDVDRQYLENLRTRLIDGLRSENIDFMVNGNENHVPGSVSLSFRSTEGEMLLHRLDSMGIAVATGSACNSKDTVVSRVIRAIRTPPDYANGTIRITFGTDNDEEQVKNHCLAE